MYSSARSSPRLSPVRATISDLSIARKSGTKPLLHRSGEGLLPLIRNRQPDTPFDYIARIVEFCRAESIALRLFLTPAHAHQLEIAALVGEWPKIEGGKRALTELIAADAQAHPDERPFRLYDLTATRRDNGARSAARQSGRDAIYWE